MAEPLWYKDAVVYELHVRSFFDGDGDGVGDFRGLIQKLDYLRDLGVTAIWLLPFYPSPLKDDGYDISDYSGVHPSYGTLRDFKRFIHEAHERGLKIITELVLNHTSDQHPWFQRARRSAPGTRWRDFYVWSETTSPYREARIIFKDFEQSNWAWDPEAGAYYWHRFYSHQPDLNYENPAVEKALCRVLDFWLGLGVDGLRLDAVPYLIEAEGTGCENLPATHEILKRLRAHVDARYEGRMLLAEANQWPEEAAAYFGDGDECHMAFHFPLMPRMFMALRMEDRFPIVDILDQTPPIPPNCQWALFLRNHDELTLEMVTDEERDYMYRVYASDPEARINLGIRRRLAPLLGNHRRRIELMNSLLFSLPGTPVIYYGDEIGMGDNVYLGDRNSVRTPMQWSADRNGGFSSANPQRLFLPPVVDPEYHYGSVHVEGQQSNPSSMLWWIKRLIALRKSHPPFARGSIEFLQPDNRRILAFIRSYGEDRILVVANLSRFVQYVELKLGQLQGMVPVELFGCTPFPTIGELPYLLTLGPHSFYWFSIEAPARRLGPAPTDGRYAALPTVSLRDTWEVTVRERELDSLGRPLAGYIQQQPWFDANGRTVAAASVVEAMAVPNGPATTHLTLVRVEYADGDPETYMLPLTVAVAEPGDLGEQRDGTGIARLLPPEGQPLRVYDPTSDQAFARALQDVIAGRRRLRGWNGSISAIPSLPLRGSGRDLAEPDAIGHVGRSTSHIVYGNEFMLKLLRRVEIGVNPEVEVGRFLAQHGFLHAPRVLATLDYRRAQGGVATLGLVQAYVPNQGDAWKYTLDALEDYFEGALARGPRATIPVAPPNAWAATVKGIEVPTAAARAIGPYLESARVLGVRTAQMHRALAADPSDPAFAPEPISELYQRSRYQAMRATARQTIALLRDRLADLPPAVAEGARAPLDRESAVLEALHPLLVRRFRSARIRCHGDYHLEQVLCAGKDFIIIDFEDEPGRSLDQRRIKRTSLRDVAGMLRSFAHAAHTARANLAAGGTVGAEGLQALDPWVELWPAWVGVAFLHGYLETMAGSSILSSDPDELRDLLQVLLVEKAVSELADTLSRSPEWAGIPIQGLLQLCQA